MPPTPARPDPYRTLGLEPGASMAEVKRAYRRLAKAYHPDSAGEAALPRFLAIHEAYEQPPDRPARRRGTRGERRAGPQRAVARRSGARSRGPGAGGASRGTAAAGPPGRRAGPRGRLRGSGARAAEDRPGSAAGRRGRRVPAARGRRRAGSPGGGAPRARPERGDATRKATLGSTSYDDARDPADATWSGASWYGPIDGEYWIVNPREYADPRKHGPRTSSHVPAGPPGRRV